MIEASAEQSHNITFLEQKRTQTGNKPNKKGEYTDRVALKITGGEDSKYLCRSLHGIRGVFGNGEPTAAETEPLLPNAEETLILNLRPITEEQPGFLLVEPPVTAAQERGLTCPFPNNNDVYELLLQ